MTCNDRFRASLAASRIVEQTVAKWLQRRGWMVLPVYDYSGLQDDKAPKLSGASDALVTPDLLGARRGETVWFEVKHKSSELKPLGKWSVIKGACGT